MMLSLLFLFVAGTTLISCKKDGLTYRSDLEKSFDTWLAFKKSSADSYSYTVRSASWTGYFTETVITVQAGEVTGRKYIAKIRKDNGAVETLGQWTEDRTGLNSHSDGAATRTLNQIYDMARTQWLVRREDADTYFEAANNGIISSCGYVPKNCQDDCFTGINITAVNAL